MRIWQGVLGVAILFGSPVIAELQPIVAQQSIWRRFTSKSWGFSIVMPGTPTERKQNGLTQFELIRNEESVRYAVGILNLPVAPGTNKNLQSEIYDGIRRGAANGQAVLISFRTIELNGFPGREMNFRLPDGMVAKWRVYLVDKRAYFINVTTTKENQSQGLATSIDVFLQSFRLARKAPKQSTPPPRPQISPSPTPTPTILPTPSASPSPTPTPEISPSPTPTPTIPPAKI
ncbi:MAG: hypothetical protein MUC48_24025 [Leptolyngbya sp. Prado105]|jgi:hypothetical protein|nr:hypothetical protein [Leptolyngbya sp. Prado105]